jgi:dTDP-4-dehydrorhamnose reductase
MRLLITGATGNLGRYLVRAGKAAGHQVIPWGSTRGGEVDGQPVIPVDLTNETIVKEHFWRAHPMAVIHAAAIASVAECHRDPVRAFKVNVEATRQLVGLCMAGIARLIFVSTDLVFDGKQGNYQENDRTHPLSMYGKSKVEAERAVLLYHGHLVARVSHLIGTGPPGRPNTLDQQIAAMKQGVPVPFFEDEWRTPLATWDAATGLVRLATSEVGGGILHLGGPERVSRYEIGLLLARALHVDPALAQATRRADVKAPEPRPCDAALNSSRWIKLCPDVVRTGVEAALRQAVAG